MTGVEAPDFGIPSVSNHESEEGIENECIAMKVKIDAIRILLLAARRQMPLK